MDTLFLLIGTFTKETSKGIYLYRFNQRTGESEYLNMAEVENPSYLKVVNGEYIYAVSENEQQPAYLSVFFFDKQKMKINLLSKCETYGEGTCHVETDTTGKYLVTANYGGGSITVFRVLPDNTVGKPLQLIKFTGSSIDKERQEASHPHCVAFSPDGNYAFVTDLGCDKIYRFDLDYSGDEFLRYDSMVSFDTEPGSGPRHLAFHQSGNYLYLINELAATVEFFTYHNGTITNMQTEQIVTVNSKGGAGINISPDGSLLFASNRLKDDGVAVFSIDKHTGRLTKACYQLTNKHPRNMVITPNGRLLLIASMNNHIIDSYEIGANGALSLINKPIFENMPVCLKFIQ